MTGKKLQHKINGSDLKMEDFRAEMGKIGYPDAFCYVAFKFDVEPKKMDARPALKARYSHFIKDGVKVFDAMIGKIKK